jgi:hypothetical protein
VQRTKCQTGPLPRAAKQLERGQRAAAARAAGRPNSPNCTRHPDTHGTSRPPKSRRRDPPHPLAAVGAPDRSSAPSSGFRPAVERSTRVGTCPWERRHHTPSAKTHKQAKEQQKLRSKQKSKKPKEPRGWGQ